MAEPYVQGGSEGSIELDDSSAAGSVENRMTVVRSLVEDVANNSGELSQEITVDGQVWRVTVERVAG